MKNATLLILCFICSITLTTLITIAIYYYISSEMLAASAIITGLATSNISLAVYDYLKE